MFTATAARNILFTGRYAIDKLRPEVLMGRDFTIHWWAAVHGLRSVGLVARNIDTYPPGLPPGQACGRWYKDRIEPDPLYKALSDERIGLAKRNEMGVGQAVRVTIGDPVHDVSYRLDITVEGYPDLTLVSFLDEVANFWDRELAELETTINALHS
jgi:hypothetical protein